MKFGYHNHDFEFSENLGGEMLYDIMMKNTDAKLVIQQLDIGNLYNGGANAAEIVKKYPGRFSSIHVKDEIKASEGNEKYESTILGAGIVNTKDVIDMVRKIQRMFITSSSRNHTRARHRLIVLKKIWPL